MRFTLALLLAANSSGPAPQPMPDATPTIRGLVNVEEGQRLRGKVFVDRVLINADAGIAYGSTCVPTFADLRPCTVSALQCVTDAGWYMCPGLDGGWATFSSGPGGSGVSSVAASAPLSSSGGVTPTISCTNASGSVDGCLSAANFTTFAAKESALSFTSPLSRSTNTISCSAATGSNPGCLSAADWTTFNTKESVLSFTTPLSRSVNTVTCSAATASAAGCLSTSTQEVGGYKDFKNGGQFDDIMQCTAQFPRTVGDLATFASQINYYGIMLGNAPLMPTFDDNTIYIMGSRTSASTAPDVIIQSSRFRDAGAFLSVLDGPGAGNQVFGVGASGDVTFQPALRYLQRHGEEPAWTGNLQDGSGLSGHIALKSSPGLYLSIGSLLQDTHSAIESDGGCPLYDGGQWVSQTGGTGVGADGGICATYYTYAGNHGDVTIIPHGKHVGGWLLEIKNPETGTSTDTKFIIDPKGGMSQPSPMHRQNFPARSVGFLTSIGQFSYGVAPSTMYYANGVGEQRWFWFDDEKADYQQFAHQAPVFLPPILINTVLSVSTLGGTVLPGSGEVAMLDAIHFYIGSAGTGGSSNVTIRAADGVAQCDYSFACNASTGPKRIAGTGLACGGAASGATLTWTVITLGDCSGGAATITGSMTPEIRWR